MMNSQRFITRQRVKYYWKALKHTGRLTGGAERDHQGVTADAFWMYEQTPRQF